jgi:HPt (histidine-containing phosphotransfer) domain-containing protein
LRATLQELIGKLTGQQQAAYFHKLERAATDNDLQSLLEDLHRLDDFDTDPNGGE